MNLKNMNDFRYEKKFYIDNMSYKEIQSIIKNHPAIFKEIFYERRINNIYMDSINLKNYNNNVAGTSERLKIRVRWYSNLGLAKNPILEIKIKNNELGKKRRFKLKNFILDKNFSYTKLQKVFYESNLPEWLIEKLKFSKPTLLNSYSRTYFITADKKYRITIDKDFIFYRIIGHGNFYSEEIFEKKRYILELKYKYKDFEKANHITQYFPFRIAAHSKYVYGIDLLI